MFVYVRTWLGLKANMVISHFGWLQLCVKPWKALFEDTFASQSLPRYATMTDQYGQFRTISDHFKPFWIVVVFVLGARAVARQGWERETARALVFYQHFCGRRVSKNILFPECPCGGGARAACCILVVGVATIFLQAL